MAKMLFTQKQIDKTRQALDGLLEDMTEVLLDEEETSIDKTLERLRPLGIKHKVLRGMLKDMYLSNKTGVLHLGGKPQDRRAS